MVGGCLSKKVQRTTSLGQFKQEGPGDRPGFNDSSSRHKDEGRDGEGAYLIFKEPKALRTTDAQCQPSNAKGIFPNIVMGRHSLLLNQRYSSLFS